MILLALKNMKQSSAKSKWETIGALLQILIPLISPLASALRMRAERPSTQVMGNYGLTPFFFSIPLIYQSKWHFLFIFLFPFINSFLSQPLNKCRIRVYNGRLPHRVICVSLLQIKKQVWYKGSPCLRPLPKMIGLALLPLTITE